MSKRKGRLPIGYLARQYVSRKRLGELCSTENTLKKSISVEKIVQTGVNVINLGEEP